MAYASSLTEPVPAASPAATCFHCGLPVAANTRYVARIDDQECWFCCPGCQAVAKAIVAAGLADFYRHRTEPARQADESLVQALDELRVYDRPAIQNSFVRSEAAHLRSASLILEGIVCAACVWLNERHVGALPGVHTFRINYSTQRAYLEWDEREIRLSDILAAITAIGYRAYPFDHDRQQAVYERERAGALRRVAVAGVGAMQVMMLALAMYFGDYYGMDADSRQLLRWISLVITLPVLLYSARPFFAAAWRGLRRRQLGMDVPVSIAIASAFCASAWHTWYGAGEVYFDSVTMFTFLLLGSRFLEMQVRQRAGRVAEQQVRMLPATAVRLGDGDAQETVAVAELLPGERVLIRPGATVPADGRVVEGISSVDESLLTGESLPLPKSVGATLIGGSLNVESPLVMEIDKVGAETVLSTIVSLTERAAGTKPPLAQLADRVAGWFVGGVLLIATAVAVWWGLHDPAVAFPITLAVLVVTCPCALSLATPTALTAATAYLTQCGLLATRAHALETLARVTHVVFDKTGTLTLGQLQLIAVESVGALDSQRCLELAAALERGSEHPVAQTLRKAAQGTLRAEQVKNTPGAGVEGWVDGARYRLGRADFVAQLSATPLVESATDKSTATRVALGDAQGVLAWFELADTLRPDAGAVVTALQAMGLRVMLLSGDRAETVRTIAGQLGIDQAEAGLMPADKLARLHALQSEGAVVAMIGDGINDAPVLAAATVSIAMGTGTQLAHAAADMILLSGRLDALSQGISVARRTVNIIRQNLSWAIGYNALATPLAATGWIVPWAAALGMSLSSLLVVGNALRLKSMRREVGDRVQQTP
ncbi:MAG: heavy metal translocating P-type ATPase [Candidatus Competibacteraceae bacterium]|jgi:Cu2+-exporting ATPase|nr:heavy metal translocating P-type ATPase [Candidatus Competibacteraceae bacterium]